MVGDGEYGMSEGSLTAGDGKITSRETPVKMGASVHADKAVADSSEVLHRLSELVDAFDHLSGSDLQAETAAKKLVLPSKF
jgi:hypothetical protein